MTVNALRTCASGAVAYGFTCCIGDVD
jgi:hypothetical protein